MGKNTTKGDKKIVLQDQLYEEILNGFKEVPGSVDAKKVILNTVYKKRLERVGEYFFANKETHHFVKSWAGNLSGTSVIDELLKKIINVKQKAQEDLEEAELDADEKYLQNDYDEKREKNIFNVLSVLKWMRFIHIIRDLYNVYQKYKTKKEEIKKEYQENFEGFINNDALSVQMKTALCIDKIEGLFKVIWKVSIKAGEVLKKFIDENKAINGLFDYIEEEVWSAVKHSLLEHFGIQVGVRAATALALTFAPEGMGTKIAAVFKWGQVAYGLYKVADLALLFKKINEKGLLGYSKEVAHEWFIDNWNLERSIKMRDEIRKSMEGIVIYGMQVRNEVSDLDREVNNALNVKNYIDGQIEDFRSDVKQDIKTAGQVADYIKHNNRAGANFESNIKAPQIQVQFDFSSTKFGGENLIQYSSKVVDMQYSIIDQIKRTNELRYNFVLTDKTYENLYGQTIYVNGKETTTGLLVLHVLKVWENNLIESSGHFYSLFYQYINDTAASFIEKVDSTINEIDNILNSKGLKMAQKFLNVDTGLSLYKFSSQETKNKIDTKKETNENVDWETMLHTNTEGLVVTQSQQAKPKVLKLPQKQEEVKKLRLSDKTLQSFHPIIGINGALTGMQIELLDENDKEIKIDVKEWTTYDNIKEIGSQEGLPNIEKYYNFMTQLDIGVQQDKLMLESETFNDDILSLILTKIQSKITTETN